MSPYDGSDLASALQNHTRAHAVVNTLPMWKMHLHKCGPTLCWCKCAFRNQMQIITCSLISVVCQLKDAALRWFCGDCFILPDPNLRKIWVDGYLLLWWHGYWAWCLWAPLGLWRLWLDWSQFNLGALQYPISWLIVKFQEISLNSETLSQIVINLIVISLALHLIWLKSLVWFWS